MTRAQKLPESNLSSARMDAPEHVGKDLHDHPMLLGLHARVASDIPSIAPGQVEVLKPVQELHAAVQLGKQGRRHAGQEL